MGAGLLGGVVLGGGVVLCWKDDDICYACRRRRRRCCSRVLQVVVCRVFRSSCCVSSIRPSCSTCLSSLPLPLPIPRVFAPIARSASSPLIPSPLTYCPSFPPIRFPRLFLLLTVIIRASLTLTCALKALHIAQHSMFLLRMYLHFIVLVDCQFRVWFTTVSWGMYVRRRETYLTSLS